MRIASISNLLARSFLVFILAYLWLTFYIRNIALVFIIAFCVAMVANYVFMLFTRRKTARKALTLKEHNHMRQITLQLKFMSRTGVRALFRRAFDAMERPMPAIYPLFNKDVTSADIITILRRTRKNCTIYIAAERFPAEVVGFANAVDRDVKLLDARAVYENILKPADIFPEVKVELRPRKKLTWRELRDLVFTRTKVRPYIIIGVVILATSFIVRFNIYYIVVATIMFSFALTCLFVVPSKRELF